MLSDVMLSVIMLRFVMLNFVMLSVIMLSDVILNVYKNIWKRDSNISNVISGALYSD